MTSTISRSHIIALAAAAMALWGSSCGNDSPKVPAPRDASVDRAAAKTDGPGPADTPQADAVAADTRLADAATPDVPRIDTAADETQKLDVAAADAPHADAAETQNAEAGIDAPASDASAPDGSAADTAPSDAGGLAKLPLAEPQAQTLTCTQGGSGPVEENDRNWLCTFIYKETKAKIYFQAKPVSCTGSFMTMVVSYAAQGWIEYQGAVAPLDNPEYSVAHHMIDSIEFDRDGLHFRYVQSSLGFGGRPCQAMDCIQVFKSDKTTLVENGCECGMRSIPAVCVEVEDESSNLPLVDSFKRCLGETRCGV